MGDYFISLTTDNASVNDVVIATIARCLLARYDIPYTPDRHIRCLAHVINLIVQSFLHEIDEADDPSENDYYELHKEAPIHYDVDNDKEQRAMEDEVTEAEKKAVKTVELDTTPVNDAAETAEETELAEDVQNQSAVRRVSPFSFDVDFSLLIVLFTLLLATLHYNQDCLIPTTPFALPENHPCQVWR